MDRIKVEFGKGKENTFEREYDRSDKESAKQMIFDYFEFFKKYRSTHTISARTWKYPVVYINNEPKAKVSPNGLWDEYKEN